MSPEPIFQVYLLGRLGGELTVLAEFGPGRAIHRPVIEPAQLQEIDRDIRNLRGFIESGFPELDESALQKLGDALFTLLIADDVERLFQAATAQTKDFLLVELVVEDFELAGWPWEYLFDVRRQVFLCQERHPLSRGILSTEPARVPEPSGERVRILLVLGVAPDDPATTPDEEVEWIREIFTAGLASDAVELQILSPTSPRDLDPRLLGERFDILHFLGHARFDPRLRQGYLQFERPGMEPFSYYANDFGRLVTGLGIRLVFLNACETARHDRDSQPARSSLAAAVLDRGVPSVIASQFSLPGSGAHLLASLIYNALLTGRPLSESVRHGRRAFSYDKNRRFFDWGIPVLYAADPRMVLFSRAEGKPRSAWEAGFERALTSGNTVKALAATGAALSGSGSAQARRRRVAIVDLDARLGFLSDLLKTANAVQQYFEFTLAYLPLPGGVARTDADSHLDTSKLETYLSDLPTALGADLACCLTRSRLSADGGHEFPADLVASLPTNHRVRFASVFGVRDHAAALGQSFETSCMVLISAAVSLKQHADWSPAEIQAIQTVALLRINMPRPEPAPSPAAAVITANGTSGYNTAKIHEFLTTSFGAGQLRRICRDYFPTVLADLGDNPSPATTADRLIEFCDQQQEFERLFQIIAPLNPRKWAIYEPVVRS